VEKFVEKLVNKIRTEFPDQEVSPYLRRPLRTLAHVLADREATPGRKPACIEADRQRSDPQPEGTRRKTG
jgi:hypothetical protein